MNNRSRKFEPYVRRYKPGDKAVSLRTACRMAFYHVMGRNFFVLLQRGKPRVVLDVAGSRRELEQMQVQVAMGRMTFASWAREIGRQARGGKFNRAKTKDKRWQR